MKIGLGLIAHNEETLIKRCLNSFLPIGFSEICVVVNNSTDRTAEFVKEWANDNHKTLILIEKEIRPFSFKDARNIYIDELNDKVDFILTVDVDDLATQGMIQFIKDFRGSHDLISFRYRTGPNTAHLNYRFFKTNIGIKYEGDVHEYIMSPPSAKRFNSDFEVIHHPTDLGHYKTSAIRNLEIFESIKSSGREPSSREIFYYANTLRDLARMDEAVEAYQSYRKKPHVYHDEWCHTFIYEARCLRFLRRPDDAIKVLTELCSKDSTWGFAWMELCFNYFYLKRDFTSALATAAKAHACPFRARLFEEQDKAKDGSETIRHLKLSYEALKLP